MTNQLNKTIVQFFLIFSALVFLSSCKEDTLENQAKTSSELQAQNVEREKSYGAQIEIEGQENLVIVFPEGRQGVVLDQGVLTGVNNAVLTFINKDEDLIYVAKTDQFGSYRIGLKPGSYFVTITATRYYSYYTVSGHIQVTQGQGYGTSDFLLIPQPVSEWNNVIKWLVYNQGISSFESQIADVLVRMENVNNRRRIFSTYSTMGTLISDQGNRYNASIEIPDYQTAYYHNTLKGPSNFSTWVFYYQQLSPTDGVYQVGLQLLIN